MTACFCFSYTYILSFILIVLNVLNITKKLRSKRYDVSLFCDSIAINSTIYDIQIASKVHMKYVCACETTTAGQIYAIYNFAIYSFCVSDISDKIVCYMRLFFINSRI